jgi:excisionase family DNA binding protein
MNILSVTQAAAELGVGPHRLRALIRSGRLKATKVGNTYVIEPRHLDAVRVRKPGRPARQV